MSDITSKLDNISNILSNNGRNANEIHAVKQEKKNDGLFEIDNSKKIVMHDSNRQVLTEWK